MDLFRYSLRIILELTSCPLKEVETVFEGPPRPFLPLPRPPPASISPLWPGWSKKMWINNLLLPFFKSSTTVSFKGSLFFSSHPIDQKQNQLLVYIFLVSRTKCQRTFWPNSNLDPTSFAKFQISPFEIDQNSNLHNFEGLKFIKMKILAFHILSKIKFLPFEIGQNLNLHNF